MATLNNNQVASILNTAIAQSTGSATVGQLDLQGIIDTGNDTSVIGSVENFTKSLINVIMKNWFTDSSYRSQYNDPFYEDSERFGAIVQAISVEMPDVQPSHEWREYTSGVTTAGEYVIFLPIIHSQFYGKSISWELPIAITGNQWDTAWRSANDLREFVSYILMVCDNTIVNHLEDMDSMNRNNFIAEKIAYSRTVGATGVHVVDLAKEYAVETGKTTLTVEDYLNDPDALRHGVATMANIKDYLGKMSTVFNTAGYKRFVPRERLVFQLLSAFARKYDSVAQSGTFNKELTELPLFQSVAFWQGSGTSFAWEDVSKINVKIDSDGTAISQSNVVGFMADKWAIMHTIKSKRVAAKVFEPENLTQYYYQFTDQYANNLTMPAVVFVLNDYTAEVSA